jgi:hypothetical protein
MTGVYFNGVEFSSFVITVSILLNAGLYSNF